MNFSQIMSAGRAQLNDRLKEIEGDMDNNWREVCIISAELSRRMGGCACPGDWITAERPYYL